MPSVSLLLLAALSLQQQVLSSDSTESPSNSYNNNARYRCGVARQDEDQWPWNAALFHWISDEDQQFSSVYACGGTLIDKRHVLTAAHCVAKPNGEPMEPSDIEVHLGQYNPQVESPQVQIRAVRDVYVHPKFSGMRHDIAILRLEDVVQFSDSVLPICLDDDTESSRAGDLEGKRGSLAAWWIYGINEDDSSSKRDMTQMMVVNNSECLKDYDEISERFDLEEVFCANMLNVPNSCKADIGYGLYFKSRGRYELRGIVSLASNTKNKNCNTSEYYSFTNVNFYYEWIRAVTFEEKSWMDQLHEYFKDITRKVFSVDSKDQNGSQLERERRAVTQKSLPTAPPFPEHG